ncbi:MAG: hypothetical protein JWL97_3450 [Gemmatimonadales bacterium]|jgi:hypothetical protein|nr:hypothetical protein [Gemmatimonadales bacterium]
MAYTPDPRYAPDPRYKRVDPRYAPDPRYRIGQPPIGNEDPELSDPRSEIQKKAREHALTSRIERERAIRLLAEMARKAKDTKDD